MKNLLMILLVITLFYSCGNNQNDNKIHERPNILWITCEDISPYLGCYGFNQAKTPNLDKLAEEGIRFTRAYANAPVCAVARSTILSGMYATSIGTHQMRSRVQLPASVPAYPKILREAGYYCTNNSKKDYNSNYENDSTLWDESSNKAHYRNRKPGQPFFAVFNNTVTHESQLSPDRINYYAENNLIPKKPRIDPSQVLLPPYHPDLPEIREDWARLHDLITLMDSMSGNLINELKEDELTDNTIVFFYSDHGGQLSRAKRYIYNVGTQVPMIVYLPEKWKHLARQNPGETNNRLVSFVDLAKTILSVTGCQIPETMQGNVFLGPETTENPGYVHFFRDRMSERYDFSRAVTDGQFYYIRNFMPHRPLGRDTRYGFQVQQNWRVWEDFYEQGKCNDVQSQFFQPKASFELFNTTTDPWHVKNIADLPGNTETVERFSTEMDRWMIETRDIGLIPEAMFHELSGKNKPHKTLYEYAQSSEYPVEEILAAAKIASSQNASLVSQYLQFISHPHPVIRFWGAYAVFLNRLSNPEILTATKNMMENDIIAANRIMAAQALGICGDSESAFNVILNEARETNYSNVFLLALNAFQYSKTDEFLTINHWKEFKKKELSEVDSGQNFGYPNRIIDDAISLWPEKRKVY